MKTLIPFLLLTWTLSSPALALSPPPSFAQVTGGNGPAFFNGKPLAVGSFITSEGEIATGKGGRLLIFFPVQGTELRLAEESSMKLIRPNPENTEGYTFTKGICSWNVKPGSPKKWVRIRTRAAILGVRGTEFLVVSNPLLGETEIVVLRGEVDFSSQADPSDHKVVSKGQWGGIGGRFGQRIGPILNLTDEILTALKQPVNFGASAPASGKKR